MNEAISIELWFFLVSIASGAILLAVYDVFRILRRLIKHDSLLIALEDLLFWLGASLFIFAMMFRENDGIIRGFSIMGMAIGMVLYHFMISDLIVSLITKLIRLLFGPFVFVYKKIKGLLAFLKNKVHKIVKFLARRLKKHTKSVRMALNKRKQAIAQKNKLRSDKKLLKKQKAREEKQARRQARSKAAGKPETKAEKVPESTRTARPAVTLERVEPGTLYKTEQIKKNVK